MPDIVLFGIGSPLCVDAEETCGRLGLNLLAGIRNRNSEVFLLKADAIRSPAEIDAALLRTPCLCPVFDPINRRIAWGEAAALGFMACGPLVDPTSVVASSTAIGDGSFVNAACVIGAAGKIGRFVVINRGAGLGHHARIADFVSVGPGVVIAGRVEIAAGATIGAGAVILPGICIGEAAFVGAGSVVTRDVPGRTKVFGSPARIIEKNLPEWTNLHEPGPIDRRK